MPSLDFKRSDRVSDLIHSEVAKIFSTRSKRPKVSWNNYHQSRNDS